MKRLPLLLLIVMVIVFMIPVTALSPSQLPQITKHTTTKPTTVPLYNVGQKTLVPVTTTKAACDPFENPQAYLTIESEPPGANISITIQSDQGTYPVDTKQSTPVSTPFFSACEGWDFRIILIKAGYQTYTSAPVVLQPGDFGQIHAVLVPLATTTTQSQGSSQPAATAVVTAPQYDFGQQAYAQGAASSGAASQPSATATAAGQPSQAPAPGTGSLSVITNPAGAAVELDGIPQGASPATIPGLAAGAHNLTIMKPGYAVLMTQVNIVAGQANEYSTTLLPSTETTKKQSPGFEPLFGALAVVCIALLARIR